MKLYYMSAQPLAFPLKCASNTFLCDRSFSVLITCSAHLSLLTLIYLRQSSSKKHQISAPYWPHKRFLQL
ncbi:unnamed protein product [Nezara viridula]|uniref:Uncharacterized protein n=1 Tax=Nezara viridula TaxID=85310 RepID=A0A9P0HQ90_NEZVI|nr:unnamed protein product [Nezara viridula]